MTAISNDKIGGILDIGCEINASDMTSIFSKSAVYSSNAISDPINNARRMIDMRVW